MGVEMFDTRGMEQLRTYIERHGPDRTHQDWADAIGISRSYFTEILNGDVQPSRRVIGLIDRATDGAVPPSAWFTRAAE